MIGDRYKRSLSYTILARGFSLFVSFFATLSFVTLVYVIMACILVGGIALAAAETEDANSKRVVIKPSSRDNLQNTAYTTTNTVNTFSREELERLIIIKPTQGRPVIVKPEQSFYFIFQFRSEEKLDIPRIEVMLSHSLCPDYKVPLISVSPPVVMQKRHIVMLLKAPALTPEGVYDLHIDLGVGYQTVKRAVKVVREFKDRIRVVHLSNMNIGLPTAPDFDRRLIDEINLLAPDFIIATGDFFASKEDADWPKLKEFLAAFNAPCYVLCGDNDDIVGYSRYISPNLTDTFDYGKYHFLLTFDTSFHPIEKDADQLQAIIDDLRLYGKDAYMSVIVCNRDNLGIIDGLRKLKFDPAIIFREGKVRAIITGSSSDWDYKEYKSKLNGLSGVEYIRTAQSSTSLKYGGDGRSHYRLIEIGPDGLSYTYSDPENDKEGIQTSMAVGGIRFFRYGRNDWSEDTAKVAVLNTLYKSFSDCRIVFRLKGTAKDLVVQNGRVIELIESGGKVTAVVGVDLPARTVVYVLATTNKDIAAKYDKRPVEFELSLPDKLVFNRFTSPEGINYIKAEEELSLVVKNTSKVPVDVSLQVCICGEAIVIKDPSDPGILDLTGQIVAIEPGKSRKFTIIPLAKNLKSGKGYVQIYLLNDPLKRFVIFPIDIEVR